MACVGADTVAAGSVDRSVSDAAAVGDGSVAQGDGSVAQGDASVAQGDALVDEAGTSSGEAGASGGVVVAPVPVECTNSVPAESVIDVNLVYKQVMSSNLIGTTNTYVVRLDVGASATTVGMSTAVVSHTEGIASQRAFRSLVLSRCAGDMTSAASVPLSINSVGASIDLSINDPGRGVPNLTTGTWYLNVKNIACTANTRCDVFIDWLHYR